MVEDVPIPRGRPAIVNDAFVVRLAGGLLGSLSVGGLLLYFFGVSSFAATAGVTLLAEASGLALLLWKARPGPAAVARQRLLGGLWAGAVATLVYDLVRVPIAMSGIPIFKAISYFGTVWLGVERPTPASELLGWAYHLSNGVSFGLMYTALVTKPGPVTAVLWGLALEGAMLLTPYAEVFGYQRNTRFMAITIGSHICYGLALWIGLHYWLVRRPAPAMVSGVAVTVIAGLCVIAADFHRLQAATLPASPPPALGPDLYVTWDVPEPDRVGALWVMKRFLNPRAQFHFVRPFESLVFGEPFDVPEAEIRRAGTLAATEVLRERVGRPQDEGLTKLAQMTHLTEITPWMLPSDPEAGQLATQLREVTVRVCGDRLRASCLDALFTNLDQWYGTTRPR